MRHMHTTPSISGAHTHTMFPVDFDPERDEFLVLSIAADRIADAAFLDNRLGGDWSLAKHLDWRDVPASPQAPRTALLFHTAFCCSTLLARTLQSVPQVIALREPQVLSQLARAALSRPRTRIEGPLRAALELLARPWTQGGRTLIKPTNQANNLLPDILGATNGKAVLLYSSLPEFVISCCKKLPEAELRVRWMAQHLLKDSQLQRELQVPWDHPFEFIEACVLTWYAQIERYADALAADDTDRLRSLDMQTLLADSSDVVAAASDWLELGVDASLLRARVLKEFQRNAKHPERPFDADRQRQEKTLVMAHYADVLDNALAWARDAIAPYARVPSDWKPLVSAHTT
jgi:hypothetical protein